MSTALEVAHQQFVAVTPTELIPAQRGVIDWCQRKIHSLALELREQRMNLRQAKTMKWKHSGWVNAVTKTKKRMIYYTKIKQALNAGYLIVPNFDVDVIAVRVGRMSPRHQVEYSSHISTKPEMLPPGQGHYVDEQLIVRDTSFKDKGTDGREFTRVRCQADEYDTDIDFPADLVKPSILAATDQAMARRLFDRIGVVRKGKRSDPIVVGQIIDPTRTHAWSLINNPTCVTFFVAWWLDSRDL